MSSESATCVDDKAQSAKNTTHLSGPSWHSLAGRIVCGGMNAIIRNRFPAIAVVALSAVMFAGFARTFYLKFLFDLPPLKLAALLHGLLATSWLVLHYTQAKLIAAQRVDI